jgi:hypothetical protein
MGRSYAYECPKCGYRTKVSGGADRGVIAWVQTVLCRDCKELYDAVTRLKVPEGTASKAGMGGANAFGGRKALPPPLVFVVNRLRYSGVKRFKWVPFDPLCPVSPNHRVRIWNDPDRCPKCAIYLEKSALPYRLWE